jgi:histidyl-tRNA synthetase
MQELIQSAPTLQDHLGTVSLEHFNRFRDYLETMGIDYTVNPRLVRGLDYYSHTVFEWITDRLGAQGTVCGGGRYDGLVEIQGGKPWPGIGFAMGQERLVELLRGAADLTANPPHAYLVMVGGPTIAAGLKLAEGLRSAIPELRLHVNLGGGSFKSQFRKADRSGAQLALILGEEEMSQHVLSIKFLRAEDQQQQVRQSEVVHWLRRWLAQG